MKKLISVIIPVYNAEKTIAKAVDSVLNQSYRDFELIVVDDCSTDNTKNILNSINDGRLKVIHLNKNSGAASRPKNKGIKMAQGEFIAFLDSDDYWDEKKLEKQVELFANEKIVLTYTNGIFIGKNKRKTNKKFSNFLSFKKGLIFKSLILSNFIPSSSVMVRRNILEKSGLFSEDKNIFVGEDYDLWLRISRLGEINYLNEPLFKYTTSDEGLSGNKKKGYKCTLYLYKKWLKKRLGLTEKIYLIIAYIKTYLKFLIVSIKVQQK